MFITNQLSKVQLFKKNTFVTLSFSCKSTSNDYFLKLSMKAVQLFVTCCEQTKKVDSKGNAKVLDKDLTKYVALGRYVGEYFQLLMHQI